MKINLGAGNDIQKGYVNHDRIKHRSEIEICFDLEAFPWPLQDNSYEEIRMWDVIEHMSNIIGVIDECWRVLKPNGLLTMKACGWKNENFWVDITHKKAFHRKSMDYFDPTTEIGKEYGFYTDKKWKIIEITEHKNNYYYKLKTLKNG